MAIVSWTTGGPLRVAVLVLVCADAHANTAFAARLTLGETFVVGGGGGGGRDKSGGDDNGERLSFIVMRLRLEEQRPCRLVVL